jgi:cell division protein FtsB
VLVVAAVTGMAVFAFEGGEYGTRDLMALRRKERDERARIARLRHEVDSLQRVEHALKTDSATQERVAREVYGMIRDGEILYQVVPRDSGKAGESRR